MSTCYIAGPMRNLPNLNFPLFNRVQRILQKGGWSVISPAEEDRLAHEPWTDPARPDWADSNYVIDDAICRRLILRDVTLILTLRNVQRDAVIMLPGWRKSVGGMGEIGVTRWAKIDTFEFEFVGENGFSLTPIRFDVDSGRWTYTLGGM